MSDVVGLEVASHEGIAGHPLEHAVNEPLPVHEDIRPALHSAIEALLADLITMAALVVDALATCVLALRGDTVDTDAVVAGDDAIDGLHRRIRTGVLHILTKEAPLARDLRNVLASLLCAGELERMGDHTAAVAAQIPHLAGAPAASRRALADLAERSAAQIHAIAEHVAARDCAEARTVAGGHAELVGAYHELVDDLLAGRSIDPTAPVTVLAAHHLERIGDRVTNVAEHLVFAVEGDVVDLG